MAKKRKKSAWMKGFVIPPRCPEIVSVLAERRAEVIDLLNKHKLHR